MSLGGLLCRDSRHRHCPPPPAGGTSCIDLAFAFRLPRHKQELRGLIDSFRLLGFFASVSCSSRGHPEAPRKPREGPGRAPGCLPGASGPPGARVKKPKNLYLLQPLIKPGPELRSEVAVRTPSAARSGAGRPGPISTQRTFEGVVGGGPD